MYSKTQELKKLFSEKQAVLENARQQLKQEFIGIDIIIDEIIDNVSSWYSLHEIQEKPLVINLWGLTGVGKSSLVNRLAELIDYSDKHYKLDMGEKDGRNSVKSILNELCENTNDIPLIITLDEFQNARTLKGPFKEEIENDTNRRIWELIDSGKIQHLEWKRGLWSLNEDINSLRNLIRQGVKVENGLVVKNKSKFIREFELSKSKKQLPFINNSLRSKVYDLIKKELKLMSLNELDKTLNTYDETQSLNFLEKAYRIAAKPEIKNFSKSLIFILGNLDEAYKMSGDFSTDINPDEFYERTLKINVLKIKEALKKRFKNEQIARLGNIHIIYPSLNQSAYKSIINLELEKISTKLNTLTGITVSFHESINSLIYKEGVYPTQGVRPILTTINQIIKSKISRFINKILCKNSIPCQIEISEKNNEIICSYLDEKLNTILIEKINHIPVLEKQRKAKKDDLQAITAVHESGHAILSASLLKVSPEVIFSVTADVSANGFVFSKFPWKYISKKEVLNRTAMFLGGLVAEEIIFGEENITSGANQDIQMATQLIASMLKREGFGKTPARYDIETQHNPDVIHKLSSIENEVEELIKKGKDLARKTLKEEKELLLQLANFLADNRVIKKDEFEEFFNRYAQKKVTFIKNGEHIFYRKHLKDTFKNTFSNKVEFPELILNKR